MKYFYNAIISIKVGLFILLIVFSEEALNAQVFNFIEDKPISLNISGYNNSASFKQMYALTASNGIILEISNTPVFSGQRSGAYYAYALSYDTNSSINNFLVGESIANLSGICFDTTQLDITVSTCSDSCNATNGTISISNFGYNNDPAFNQAYVLTDTLGVMLQIKENPLTTSPLYAGMFSGNYYLYAINYDTSKLLTGLNLGNSITDIVGDCMNVSKGLCYKVCDSNYDLGDLPDTSDSTATNDYQTLLSNNGPRHLIIKNLFLGDSIDMEFDGQPNGQAFGDGADEDGIIISSTMNLVPGIDFRLPFDYTNITGDTAHLEAWVDWNADGQFDRLNEMVVDWEDVNSPFPNQMEINIPKNAVTETAIGLRIRLSLQDNMSPYGLINSGEVEDYILYLDCPKVYFPFKLNNNQ